MNLSTIILFNNFLTIYFFIKSLCSIAKCHYSLEEAKIAKCKFLLLIFSFYIRYYEGFCGGGRDPLYRCLLLHKENKETSSKMRKIGEDIKRN